MSRPDRNLSMLHDQATVTDIKDSFFNKRTAFTGTPPVDGWAYHTL